uniref:Uncharacterized protein n=1 Tax=Anguilla anguilla TaxID=7936 RepID=A0A0E9Y2D2_ANGAN
MYNSILNVLLPVLCFLSCFFFVLFCFVLFICFCSVSYCIHEVVPVLLTRCQLYCHYSI